MGMVSWAFTAAWWSVRIAYCTAGAVSTAIAWLLSLPFRLVMLLYRMAASCLLLSLKLLDIYWRVMVIEKAMLFSWIIYELVFSLSLLIVLKAVTFLRRALWACHIFPEGQGWRKYLKSVSPGPDTLCSICLEPFQWFSVEVPVRPAGPAADCCTTSQTTTPFTSDIPSRSPYDTATEDCCTSTPSSRRSFPTPRHASPATPSTYFDDARSAHTLPASSLSSRGVSSGTPSAAGYSTSSLPRSYSASFSDDSNSSPSDYSYSSLLDDSASQQRPQPPSRPPLSTLSFMLLLPLSWLPASCQALLLRLLIALGTGSRQLRGDPGAGLRAGGAALGGPLAPSSACELPCGHTFCRPCVTRWLEQHQQTCPLCRRSIHTAAGGSKLAQWLAGTTAGRRIASAAEPLAGFGRAVWSLLMALLLCGPFVYGWYYTVRLAGARVGVYHHLLSQSACVDLLLCLVLFVRVLQRRCTLDPNAAAAT